MTDKMTKAKQLAEQRIERAYSRACSGVPIGIMDIPKVFAVGHKAIAGGADDAELELVLATFVESIRK